MVRYCAHLNNVHSAIASQTLGCSEFDGIVQQTIRQAKRALAARSATRYARARLPG